MPDWGMEMTVLCERLARGKELTCAVMGDKGPGQVIEIRAAR